jgi:hypothetical protein
MSLTSKVLQPNATITDINSFLSKISIPGWKVHPKIVEFNNARDRQKKIALLHSKLEKVGAANHVIQNQTKELYDADILPNAIKSLKQSGSVLMLCGDWERDLQQSKSPNEQLRHVVLVFLKEKTVSAYLYSFYFILTN